MKLLKTMLLGMAITSLVGCAGQSSTFKLTIGESYYEKLKGQEVKLKDTATEKESYSCSANRYTDEKDEDGKKYVLYSISLDYSYVKLNDKGQYDVNNGALLKLYFANANANIGAKPSSYYASDCNYVSDFTFAPESIKVYANPLNLSYGEGVNMGGSIKNAGKFKITSIKESLPAEIECLDGEIPDTAKQYAMDILTKAFKCMNSAISKANLANIFKYASSSGGTIDEA